MDKEFYLKLKLANGIEYNALQLEQLLWKAITMEHPQLDITQLQENDVTITPI